MAKPGRNDRCPCGSGKKYKACCLTRDESADREAQAKAQAVRAQTVRDSPAADERQTLREVHEALVAGLARDDDDDGDALTAASNAVLDLIRTAKLDEAEAAARTLLAQYPDVHDGWDRLGRVHEARGETRQAANCYRRVIAFLEQNPDYSESAFKDAYVERIAKLDPPAAD